MSEATEALSQPAATTETKALPAASTETTPALALASSGYDLSSFDPDTKGLLERKGFKTVADLAAGYTNLEKITGVDKVAKPVNGEMTKWFGENKDATGVPAKAEEYRLPDIDLPKGMELDKPLLESARKFAHENNIPQDLFAKFAGFVMQDRIGMGTAAADASARAEQETTAALKKEWGGDYDKKLELARMAARSLKVDDDTLNALDKGMGSAGLLRHFATLGGMLGEGSMKNGDGLGFGSERVDAKQQLAALKLDGQFMKTLQDAKATGHDEAKAKWARLHAAAEGEKAT